MTILHADRGRHLAIAAVVATLAGGLFAAPPAAAQEKLDELKEQGFARIAIANEPPYTAVAPDGTVSGAGPEVARAVFKRMGVEDVVASISEYGAMIPGLQAGRFDVVTAGLFMKPQRCQAVAYSQPVLCDTEAFLVKEGNPSNFKTYEDVAADEDAKIGVPGGGTEERLALAAGVPRSRVVVVPDGQSGVDMLQDGRIDVYSLPTLSLKSLIEKAEGAPIALVSPVEGAPAQCSGAAFAKNATALRDAFDKELAALKESGEFAKIVEPYGFNAQAAKETTREQLCAAPAE